MKNKTVSVLMIITLLMFNIIFIIHFQPAESTPTTWIVDDGIGQGDFTKIQDAVNVASPGDTIFVFNGTYIENVMINKSLTLIGQDRFFTIVDGNSTSNVFRVNASNVTIKGFTIRNSGIDPDNSGIFIFRAANITAHDNIVTNNNKGIHLRRSNNTQITDNTITNNKGPGIRLADNNTLNTIASNKLQNNTVGIEVQASSNNNTFYRNSLINNTQYQVQVLGGVYNKWDNSVEGNYWNDYMGTDLNGDGIGDTDTPTWTDYKPLIEPWSPKRMYPVNISEVITVESNFTIASFRFNQTLRRINFRITGPADWGGFCNVTIPKAVINVTLDTWRVFIGGVNKTGTTVISETNADTSLYFNGTIAGHTAWVITKSQAGEPPIADFEYEPLTPSILDTIDFFDYSIDPDGEIHQRLWNFGDGSTTNLTNPQHKYSVYSDTYIVTLTVWDIEYSNATANKVIILRNIPPDIIAFSVSSAIVTRGDSVNITVNCEDAEDAISNVSLKITSPDNTEYKYPFANTTFINVTFSTYGKPNGNYTVDVEVKDNKGLSATESATFTVVLPSYPWLVANFTYTPAEPRVGEPVRFKDESYDTSGEMSWLWNFGDGTNSTSQSPTHSYAHVGSFYVTLGVRDLSFENSTTNQVNVVKMETSVTMSGPTQVKAGDPIMISARLEDSIGQSLAGKNITFNLSGGTLQKSVSRVTDASGSASMIEYLLMSGTYNISVHFEGDQDYYGCNASRVVAVNPLSTSFTLPSQINATQHETAVLLATLKDENNDSVKHVTVDFYVHNGTAWQKIGSSQTSDGGIATLEYSPPNPGNYQLMTVFAGNEIYLASNATSILSVTATTTGIDYAPYVFIGIFISIVIIAVILILRRRR